MNKNLKEKKINQSGQALMLSLCVFMGFGLWALYLVFVSESSQRAVLNNSSVRKEALAHSREITDILNQITINNRYILSALLTAMQAVDEGYSLAKMRYSSLAPWENKSGRSRRRTQEYISRKIRNETKLIRDLQNESIMDDGEEIKMDELSEEIFVTYGKIGAKALRIAGGFTKKNQILLRELDKKSRVSLRNFVKQTSLAKTTCFALSLGFRGESLDFNKSECFLFDSKSDFSGSVLNVKKYLSAWDSEYTSPIGVSIVEPLFATKFLSGLVYELSEPKQSEFRFKTFLQLFSQHFKETANREQSKITVYSMPVHPDLFLSSNCKNYSGVKQLLTLNELDLSKDCGIDKKRFLLSFFKTNWVPVIADLKKKSDI